MPEKSGLSILEEIKMIDGSIQVIMLTGMVSMATIRRATQLGAEECLFKPIYDLNELGNAADRAYEKMLRWWRTLREWKSRNSGTSGDSQLLGPNSNVQLVHNEPRWNGPPMAKSSPPAHWKIAFSIPNDSANPLNHPRTRENGKCML